MADDLKNKAPIYWAYQQLFGRAPNAGELDYWRSVWGQGGLNPDSLKDTIEFSARQQGQTFAAAPETPAAPDAPSGHDDVLDDYEYAAYLRKMQFDESQIQSNLAAQREAIERQTAARAGQFDFQRFQSSRDIEKDYASRGLRRAGARQRDTREARAMIDQNQVGFETDQSERRASLERDAANRIGELRRERGEQELAARRRKTLGSV